MGPKMDCTSCHRWQLLGMRKGWEYLTQATSSHFSISCFRKTMDKRYKMSGMRVLCHEQHSQTDYSAGWWVLRSISRNNVYYVVKTLMLIGIPFSRCPMEPMETTGSTSLDKSSILRRSDRQLFNFTHRDVKSTKQCSILARQNLK